LGGVKEALGGRARVEDDQGDLRKLNNGNNRGIQRSEGDRLLASKNPHDDLRRRAWGEWIGTGDGIQNRG